MADRDSVAARKSLSTRLAQLRHAENAFSIVGEFERLLVEIDERLLVEIDPPVVSPRVEQRCVLPRLAARARARRSQLSVPPAGGDELVPRISFALHSGLSSTALFAQTQLVECTLTGAASLAVVLGEFCGRPALSCPNRPSSRDRESVKAACFVDSTDKGRLDKTVRPPCRSSPSTTASGLLRRSMCTRPNWVGRTRPCSKKAGVKGEPKSWDEFIAALQAVQKAGFSRARARRPAVAGRNAVRRRGDDDRRDRFLQEGVHRSRPGRRSTRRRWKRRSRACRNCASWSTRTSRAATGISHPPW